MKQTKKQIELTDNLSFCMGVQKSINLINEIIEKKEYKYVYMLGELIHNYQVIRDLEQKGIRIIKDINNIPELPKDSIMIVQSHGISPHIYEELKKRNIHFIDSTCSLVKRIHKAISQLEEEEYYPLIIGDPTHTEVIGIAGYAKHKPIVINKIDDINKSCFVGKDKIGIVIQSTVFYDRAREIINEIKSIVNDVKVIDTICAPTKSRQSEILEKSKKFKSVVVVGSKTSSNTNKLYSIAKSQNFNTFLVESESDIECIDFSNLTPVLLTSGASAPKYLIQAVEFKIKKQIEQI